MRPQLCASGQCYELLAPDSSTKKKWVQSISLIRSNVPVTLIYGKIVHYVCVPSGDGQDEGDRGLSVSRIGVVQQSSAPAADPRAAAEQEEADEAAELAAYLAMAADDDEDAYTAMPAEEDDAPAIEHPELTEVGLFLLDLR